MGRLFDFRYVISASWSEMVMCLSLQALGTALDCMLVDVDVGVVLLVVVWCGWEDMGQIRLASSARIEMDFIMETNPRSVKCGNEDSRCW